MKTALIIVMIISVIVAIAAFVFIIIDFKQEKKANQTDADKSNHGKKHKRRGIKLDESELDGTSDDEEVQIEVS
jgi:uncharacterized protein YxeA